MLSTFQKSLWVRFWVLHFISAYHKIEVSLHPLFLKCAEQLECPPQRCVVIEDSIFGVTAAKKAKMKCIAVPSGAYSEKELQEEKPNLIVNSISEKDRILHYISAESQR